MAKPTLLLLIVSALALLSGCTQRECIKREETHTPAWYRYDCWFMPFKWYKYWCDFAYFNAEDSRRCVEYKVLPPSTP